MIPIRIRKVFLRKRQEVVSRSVALRLLLLCFFLRSSSSAFQAAAAAAAAATIPTPNNQDRGKEEEGGGGGIFTYNVCNGLSNQLLIHASAIAKAIQHERADVVHIPDAFIVNGEQTSEENVLPNEVNSIPLGMAFNITFLKERLRQLGIDMELQERQQQQQQQQQQLVDENNPNMDCPGLSWLSTVDPQLVLQILKAFQPSPILQRIIQNIQGKLYDHDHHDRQNGKKYRGDEDENNSNATYKRGGGGRPLKPIKLDKKNGICFHHRDGKDWHDHCKRWSAMQSMDGVYRGNCEASQPVQPEQTNNDHPLLELLQNRALTAITNNNNTNNSTPSDRWIYYCGDHDEIPQELQQQEQRNQAQYIILHKNQLISEADRHAIQELSPTPPLTGGGPHGRTSLSSSSTSIRDLWALIDFFVCGDLHYLVGNSVSTFTALQVALREQEGAYWYNSQSIPLGNIWNIYQIPIVYTYTERSDSKGKLMLQVSIASLRQHMPQNKVYILYNGDRDHAFRQWLLEQNVTIFEHRPTWMESIERMRQKGLNSSRSSSHLFRHPGNYLGTWQRIDIPQFIETEYCLLLDFDTVIVQPFTLKDFGSNLTRGIGMSAERDRHYVGNRILNAGVTLMNVPHMRATYQDFLQFILDHVEKEGGPNSFDNPCPSDQGAYIDYYKHSLQQISNVWNWKAYWGVKNKKNLFDKIKILHFHGMKPHDYVRKLLGESCDNAIHHLCERFRNPIFKATLQRFLQAAASIPSFHKDYCNSTFNAASKRSECVSALDGLLANSNSNVILLDSRRRRERHGRDEEEDSNNLKGRMRANALLGTEDGFWDGNHNGLNSKVVSVSRPAERVAEESAQEVLKTVKLRELSYEHLHPMPDEAFPPYQDIPNVGNDMLPSNFVLPRFQMLLLACVMSMLFFLIYLGKNRRLYFVLLVGGSVAWHSWLQAALLADYLRTVS